MPKQERRRAGNVVAMPTTDPLTGVSGVSDGDVAHRAYELYCARGCEDGHDLEDWLNAERELRPGTNATAA